MMKIALALSDNVTHAKPSKDFISNIFDAKVEIIDFPSTASIYEHGSRPTKNKAKKLDFQVMFSTGCDKLNVQDQERLTSIANYLSKRPKAKVRLDGHADPRGTDEYNNVLAYERAKSVAKHLMDRGVKSESIELFSHGSIFASEIEAKHNHYAYERRVHIEVSEEHE